MRARAPAASPVIEVIRFMAQARYHTDLARFRHGDAAFRGLT
jgi:hypothetical protein